MSKIFYDHLIIIEEVIAVLDEHKLSPKERTQLLQLMDQTLHHRILDVILTLLPKAHHGVFLSRFHKAPHDTGLIPFLKEKTNADIEGEILKEADSVKKELIGTIKKSRR